MRPSFKELTCHWERMLEDGVEYLDLNPRTVHNQAYFANLHALDSPNGERGKSVLRIFVRVAKLSKLIFSLMWNTLVEKIIDPIVIFLTKKKPNSLLIVATFNNLRLVRLRIISRNVLVSKLF